MSDRPDADPPAGGRPQCSCPPGRQLGMDHRSSCPLWEFTNMDGSPRDAEAAQVLRSVPVVRNPVTQRPVAVPEEIVEEAEREYRAYKMFRGGHTWKHIAETEDWPNAQAASEAVKRYLDEGRAVIADMRRNEVLATEVDYLRDLRVKLQDGVDVGKPSHIMAALAVSKQLMTALALDQPDPEDTTAQTVVVPSEEYIASLRVIDGELVEEEDQAHAG